MLEVSAQQINYQRIARAIHFLTENTESQPSLKDLSDFVGVSEFHLQRVFSEWAGVSPKQFLQYLTKENAKQLLKKTSVMEAALSCGLSGSGRLHDLMVTCEGVTPGEYKSWGAGVKISYGLHSSPFGFCFIATTRRGICKLAFFDSYAEGSEALDELKADWFNAVIYEDQHGTAKVADTIFGHGRPSSERLHVLLRGSPFQLSVWDALLKIPRGQLSSYQQVADSLGKPSSVRAVASAVGRNSIAYLIPCHRVIRNTGMLNNYRWGSTRKAAIIGLEASETQG